MSRKSWAEKKVDVMMDRYLAESDLSTDDAVANAIRETIEECARQCDAVVAEFRSGKTKMHWTGEEAAKRIRALLEPGHEGEGDHGS